MCAVGSGEIAVNNVDADVKPLIIEIDKDKLKVAGTRVNLQMKIFLPRESSENWLDEPAYKRRRRYANSADSSGGIHYTGDMDVSVGGSVSLLDGDYELLLTRRGQVSQQPQHPQLRSNVKRLDWRRLFENNENVELDRQCDSSPKVEMFIARQGRPCRTRSATHQVKKEPIAGLLMKKEFALSSLAAAHNQAQSQDTNNDDQPSATPSGPASQSQGERIYYRFIHNNGGQLTISQQGYICPICYLKCMAPRALYLHLRCSHSRLKYTFTRETKNSRVELRIDVMVNETYDGSYSGNPFDLSHSTTGYAFSRNGPVRRTPVTTIMVSKRTKRGGIDPDDDDMDYIHPLVMGHDRLYYHTNTCAPIRPQDMDIDSEEENDPEWMKTKTQLVSKRRVIYRAAAFKRMLCMLCCVMRELRN